MRTVTFWRLWIEDDNSHNANQRLLPEASNITANQRSLPTVQIELQHGGKVIVCRLRTPGALYLNNLILYLHSGHLADAFIQSEYYIIYRYLYNIIFRAVK